MQKQTTTPQKTDAQEDWLEDLMEFREQVVSMTDCTGLIPSMPKTDAQAESYTSLYPIPNQKPQSHLENHRP